MSYRTLAVLLAVAALQGCATGPEKTEADFGNSVHRMIAIQKNEPPVTNRPSSYDGRQAEKVLQTYRGTVGSHEQLKQDVMMNMGK
jgi:type IV pilus biogenesis protein CpaD/CtpE